MSATIPRSCSYTVQLLLLSILALTSSIEWNHTTTSFRTRRRQAAIVYRHYTVPTTTLGAPNPDAAIGNPLKGLMESPQYNPPPFKADIPHSLEFYYLYLDDILVANRKLVGEAAAFNWTVVDRALSGSASRSMHAVLRVIIHFPGRPLRIPKYLYTAGIELRNYTNGTSPYYGNAVLMEAMEQFVVAFGKRYDKDKRLAYLQAGLLGYWGEWHTFGNRDFLPNEVMEAAVRWYAQSFTETKIQVRYPRLSAYNANFGLHDDSFTFQTLDGDANGGRVAPSYFWPSVVAMGAADFWKQSVMGGETKPESQKDVFEPTYTARSFQKQSFMECVNVTHTTYMLHHGAFRNGGLIGAELVNARFAHARMGYNFVVSRVTAWTSTLNATTSAPTVAMEVTVAQIGVAPFYFDLNLTLRCTGMTTQTLGGVETLVEMGSLKTFSFYGIPATDSCLTALILSLDSSYTYVGRPIRFAQGDGSIVLNIPLPTSLSPWPTMSPISPPTGQTESPPSQRKRPLRSFLKRVRQWVKRLHP